MFSNFLDHIIEIEFEFVYFFVNELDLADDLALFFFIIRIYLS